MKKSASFWGIFEVYVYLLMEGNSYGLVNNDWSDSPTGDLQLANLRTICYYNSSQKKEYYKGCSKIHVKDIETHSYASVNSKECVGSPYYQCLGDTFKNMIQSDYVVHQVDSFSDSSLTSTTCSCNISNDQVIFLKEYYNRLDGLLACYYKGFGCNFSSLNLNCLKSCDISMYQTTITKS